MKKGTFYMIAAVSFLAPVAAAQEQTLDVALIKEDRVPLNVLIAAERTARRIYAAIGIKLEFSGRTDDLSIEFEPGQQPGKYPGALGYAQPFASGGTRIHILYERLQAAPSSPRLAALLGHVMAHEIGHVLEASDHHSDEGVMKAHWDQSDVEEMTVRPLPFSQDDAAWIRGRVYTLTTRNHGSRKPNAR